MVLSILELGLIDTDGRWFVTQFTSEGLERSCLSLIIGWGSVAVCDFVHKLCCSKQFVWIWLGRYFGGIGIDRFELSFPGE